VTIAVTALAPTALATIQAGTPILCHVDQDVAVAVEMDSDRSSAFNPSQLPFTASLPPTARRLRVGTFALHRPLLISVMQLLTGDHELNTHQLACPGNEGAASYVIVRFRHYRRFSSYRTFSPLSEFLGTIAREFPEVPPDGHLDLCRSADSLGCLRAPS
jgi:hypothetical protein